jgi:HK97 gp10 family phage protein
MASAVTLELIGMDLLQAGFTAANQVATTEPEKVMQRSLLLIEGAAKAKAPKKSGRLAGGISHRLSSVGGTITGEVGPSAKYGLYVEEGTRPHWMPPGILPFPVMRAIARKGTRAQPYMLPAFEANEARVTAMFEDIGIKVVQAITRG